MRFSQWLPRHCARSASRWPTICRGLPLKRAHLREQSIYCPMLSSHEDAAISGWNHGAQVESNPHVMRNWQWLLACLALAMACAAVSTARAESGASPRPYGLTERSAPPPYLNMPHRSDGKMPLLLSQTGAF